jgi:phospho-N-acetylmuramoyl-pentapeptide-transferase
LLYWLLYQQLFAHFPPFRIFKYVTFRTAFASLTALFMGLIIGPAIIRQLRDFQIGQYIREEGPKGHQKKAGTPTMGGVLIILALVVSTLTLADIGNSYVLLALFGTVGFGVVGFMDDYLKLTRQNSKGLPPRAKLLGQLDERPQVNLTISPEWLAVRSALGADHSPKIVRLAGR